jgi:uncharacterized protein YbaA (DUF1428 family)
MNNQKSESNDGMYAHIFVYRIPKRNHDSLLNVQVRLARIYKKHGTLRSRIYQLGESYVFQGFEGFDMALSATPEEEVWVEVDSYPNAAEFKRIVAEIGEDEEAEPLWGELARITAGRPIIMGEFAKLS